MGGFGSGRWYRGSGRVTCEEPRRIDIRYMKRQEFLRPNCSGSLSWECNGEPGGNIRFTVWADKMILNYNFRYYSDDGWHPVEQTIWFDRAPCNYGGEGQIIHKH